MARVIIDNSIFNGIPFNEYYQNNVKIKGLVFVQHGFQSNKNRGADYLCLNLARLGYKAVSIDAYKHGERKEEPFVSQEDYKRYADAFNVVDQTAKDIIEIFEKNYKTEFNSFDIVGISMGGFIAYMVSIYSNYVNKLIPVISTPQFEKLVTTRDDIEDLKNYRVELDKILDKIKRMDPSNQVNRLKYNSLFILNGTEDEIVDFNQSVDFFESNKTDHMSLKLYECGHETPRYMQVDILEFIANEKVVLWHNLFLWIGVILIDWLEGWLIQIIS